MFIASTDTTPGGYGANNNPYINIETPETEAAKLQQKQAAEAGGSEILSLARKLGMEVNDDTKDYLIQYYLNETSRKNAWNDSVFAAQNQYQWLVEDLKKAGLNPFLAMSGLNAAGATSTGQSSSGGLITSKANNQLTNQSNIIKAIVTGLLSIVGIALFKKA